MNTTTVILTPKPKKGKPVSYAAILKAIRTVNARHAQLKAQAEMVSNEAAVKRRRTKKR
ncbi:MAG: hypothetical protein ACTHLE_08245 [Agriterribacter sp.]